MMYVLKKAIGFACLAAAVTANTFLETSVEGGDAGDKPGLTQTSCGADGHDVLLKITGLLDAADAADMYEIYIYESVAFAAETTSDGDPMLSLYTPDSTGVVIDDDSSSQGTFEAMVTMGTPAIDKFYIAVHRYVATDSGPYDITWDTCTGSMCGCLFTQCISGSPTGEVLIGIPSSADAVDLTYDIDFTQGSVSCTDGLVPRLVPFFTVENGWDSFVLRWTYYSDVDSYYIIFGTWEFAFDGAAYVTSFDEASGLYTFEYSLLKSLYFMTENSAYFFSFQVSSSTVVGLRSAKATYSITYNTLSTCYSGTMDGDETGIDCGGSCEICPPSCDDGILNQDESQIDCGGSICDACPISCIDGILNQDEVRIDCGGPNCDACPETCDDSIMNQDETDVDCGGSICPVCPPSCTDGIMNGSETKIDCGGKLCLACCANGFQNEGEDGIDCGGDCDACPTCDDGILNQDEELVDCGGPNCDACPTCEDGILNQGEELVDCGGPCMACPTCEDGILNQGEELTDCGGPCIACPTCEDGILNQGEELTDCGGPCMACPTCDDGIMNRDEEETDCGGLFCPACESCVDGIWNQDEEGVDCGGECSPCPTCDDGMMNRDEDMVDCGGAFCPACETCHDGILNQDEEKVDCGGVCDACPPTCDDMMMNGDEQGVDCGGSSCLLCNEMECGNSNECASGYCHCYTPETPARRRRRRLNMIPIPEEVCACADMIPVAARRH